MDAPRIAWFGLLAIATVWAALLVLGPWRWRRRTQRLHDRLLAGQVAHPTTRYHATELQGLPPVVQRYFRTVKRILLERQQADGRWRCRYGPGDAFGTAVSTLILQIPLQYLPIFQR